MPRSYAESTEVGYRIRGIEPPDLGLYPDSVKIVYWNWVVEQGLIAKDQELAKGLDKDGEPLKRLKPATIAHRKSEVGPVTKTAPPLQPALARSRVRALLKGRAHVNSAEFWWGFDSVSGASFAEILRGQREQGRDVFGISPKAIQAIQAASWRKWDQYKREHPGMALRGFQGPAIASRGYVEIAVSAKQHPRYSLPLFKREIQGRRDVESFDVSGHEELIKREVAAKRFPGFRRLNLRGEQWKPGHQLGEEIPPFKKPVSKPAPKPSPVTPATVVMPVRQRLEELATYAQSLGVPSTVSTKEEFIKALPGPWAEGALGAWDPHSGKLYFNLGSEAWVDPKAYFEKMRKANWLTDPTPAGFIHHEIGHSRLYNELVRRLGKTEAGKRFQAMLHDTFEVRDPDHKLRERIRRLISRMAAMNANEFVAEVHAGLMTGRIYPADIMRLYDELGGVRP